MPIRHIVLFKFENFNQEKERKIENAFNSLKDLPPLRIRNFGFGRTCTERGQGYTHVLTLDLESKEALKEYSSNAKHIAVINDYIKPNLEAGSSPLAMDIEVE